MRAHEGARRALLNLHSLLPGLVQCFALIATYDFGDTAHPSSVRGRCPLISIASCSTPKTATVAAM